MPHIYGLLRILCIFLEYLMPTCLLSNSLFCHILQSGKCHGTYQTYFMIVFLIDLYRMENTCVCLNIIKIETNFLSLFSHYSIIKIFCSREQALATLVHTHTFIELKKKIETMTVTKLRLWQGSENCFWRPQGILRCFFGFLCSVVLTILSGCLMELVGPCLHHGVHAQRRGRAFSDKKLQGAWEPNFSMVRTGRSTECFSRPYNDCYRWRGRIWKEEGILNTAKYTELLNTSWTVRVSSELSGRRKTTILSLETVRHFPKSILRFWISLTRSNLNIGSANSSSKFKLV